ncbi:hypothetical protein CW731_05575 [Polaribacter sp. ALD11]|uniref:DUF6904 family protein n=1 Tax=Polaribacter sp. ALD11 TaxID=2058137 RepID=UPI000C318B3A|nr:hypothetical protein [Polaribacter sp. ALD11]AUC84795.1 hypothetical protein CW731_05575 [Polaribacter sp. ALD11]
MFYLKPTKNGIGIEIWGTYDDIRTVHSIVQNFWGNEKSDKVRNSEERDDAISGFSYELRKTHEGSRLKRKTSHFSFEEIEHLGCKLTWVHIIFALSALRFNMRYLETNKLEISIFMQFEFWLEKSAIEYDEKGGLELKHFFSSGDFGENEKVYQLLNGINADFLILNGGKKAFRKLPELLRRGIPFTSEYREYEEFLKKEAKRHNCEVHELTVNENNIDFENLKW